MDGVLRLGYLVLRDKKRIVQCAMPYAHYLFPITLDIVFPISAGDSTT